jgi:hypothetical protein
LEDTPQSSLCESDLEYTNHGNIRASTYKRNEENQRMRKMLKQQQKYKSEERKKGPSFFSDEYLNSRYVNDRVEMELKDFKEEIEKKFSTSKLRDFKYPVIPSKKKSMRRGHSAEEENGSSLNLASKMTLGGKNVIFKT